MTRQDAINWLKAQNGKYLDFDGEYGAQCVDFFNFYYKFLTGRNPYSDGYGVPGAKDLWNVTTSLFTKVANNPQDPNQIPQPGDILIYNSSWGDGEGHVEVVLSADSKGVNMTGENEHGNPQQGVIQVYRSWGSMVGGLIGWLSFNNFTTSTPMITLPQLTQIYQDLLQRQPDQGGINHYVGHYTYDFTQSDIKNSAEYRADQVRINEPTPPTTPPKTEPSSPPKATTPPAKPPVTEPEKPTEPPQEKPIEQKPANPPATKSPKAPAKDAPRTLTGDPVIDLINSSPAPTNTNTTSHSSVPETSWLTKLFQSLLKFLGKLIKKGQR